MILDDEKDLSQPIKMRADETEIAAFDPTISRESHDGIIPDVGVPFSSTAETVELGELIGNINNKNMYSCIK